MTNPNDAIGTNAAYNGRTSVNAFNDALAAYSHGVLSGWAASPAGGLKIAFGGNGSVRDVAVAEDNAGNKVSINNVSGSPVEVSVSAAPGSNSRIDAIVAYVDNPPQGVDTVADNPEACGIISVDGTASSSPTKPSDGAIRSAITADGASGATAYYVVLATVTVASGTTDITADVITPGVNAMIQARNLDFETFNCYNYKTSQTNLTENFASVLTVDVTKIPDGKKFIVEFFGTATGTGTATGFAFRVNYNSTNSNIFDIVNTWGKSLAGCYIYTKVSGQNTVTLYSKKDNPTSCNCSSAFCICRVLD